MNTLIQCIVLLACAAISTSSPIKRCMCIGTSSFVLPPLIADVKVYDPRPTCSKREVIIVLKDKSKVCLDPAGKFAEAVLRTIAKQKKTTVTKMTTASPTPLATMVPAS